jgi:hypothetical protein
MKRRCESFWFVFMMKVINALLCEWLFSYWDLTQISLTPCASWEKRSLESKLGVNDQGYDECTRDLGSDHFGKPIVLYRDHIVGWFLDCWCVGKECPFCWDLLMYFCYCNLGCYWESSWGDNGLHLWNFMKEIV